MGAKIWRDKLLIFDPDSESGQGPICDRDGRGPGMISIQHAAILRRGLDIYGPRSSSFLLRNPTGPGVKEIEPPGTSGFAKKRKSSE